MDDLVVKDNHCNPDFVNDIDTTYYQRSRWSQLRYHYYVITIILFILALLPGCRNQDKNSETIEFKKLIEKNVDITSTITLEGHPIGINLEKGELYTIFPRPDIRKFLVRIVDIPGGSIKKEVELQAGNFDSPLEFYNPSHMQNLSERFFIVDQFDKIVVYNNHFQHLFSNMFHTVRTFLDIYSFQNKTYFITGIKQETIQMIESRIERYHLEENQRPVLDGVIFQSPAALSLFSCSKNSTDYHRGFFWPCLRGFQRKGKIYFAHGLERCIHVMDIATGQERIIDLAYLQPVHYNNQAAEKVGYYKSGGWEQRFYEKKKIRVVYMAYPGKVFHFGIYDLGEDLIGIVADIDTETMTFRLDLIETKTSPYHYVQSIRLPFSRGFIQGLTHNARDFIKTIIDWKHQVYIWGDINDKDDEYYVKISRFKVL